MSCFSLYSQILRVAIVYMSFLLIPWTILIPFVLICIYPRTSSETILSMDYLCFELLTDTNLTKKIFKLVRWRACECGTPKFFWKISKGNQKYNKNGPTRSCKRQADQRYRWRGKIFVKILLFYAIIGHFCAVSFFSYFVPIFSVSGHHLQSNALLLISGHMCRIPPRRHRWNQQEQTPKLHGCWQKYVPTQITQ